MEIASIEELTTDTVISGETRLVELPSGKAVRVRGLTRYEMMLTRKGTEDITLIEARTLSFCMVEPIMTVAQVTAWQKATGPMVIGPVTEAIRDLSGLGEGAEKSAVREMGEQS